MSDNGGVSYCEQGNVSDRVKVLHSIHTANPKPFLTGLLKARIVAPNFSSDNIISA